MTSAYLQSLLEQVDRSSEFTRFLDACPEEGEYVRFHGFEASARALVLARARQQLKRPILVVTHDAESAEAWYDDFLHFGVEDALHFPMTETLPYEALEPVIGIVAHQYEALQRLLAVREGTEGSPPVVVAPVEALQRKVPSPAEFSQFVLSLEWGDAFSMDEMADHLVAMGYERESMTEARGEFSMRGHIVDIFSPQMDFPVRLDLFGDEIESLRFFDTTTQRSLRDQKEIERITILPASVWALCERLARVDESPTDGDSLVGLNAWLPEDTLVVLDRPERFDHMLEQFDRIAVRRYRELTEPGAAAELPEFSSPESQLEALGGAGEPLPVNALFLSQGEVHRLFEAFGQVHVPELDVFGEPTIDPDDAQGKTDDKTDAPPDPVVFDFGVTSYESIPSDVSAYLSVMQRKQLEDYSIQIVCDNPGQVTRLEEMLAEREIASGRVLPDTQEAAGYKRRELLEGFQDVVLTTGLMHTGFIFPDAQLMVVTDREMFGRYKRRHVYRKASKGKPIASASEIQRGDYVVHLDHGIGRFLGIRNQKIDGRETELIEIEYSDSNKLLVPIENVRYVQKFTSVEGAQPPLDRMGGKRWLTRKKKSQERIELMAQELLEIYAQRKVASGFTFSEDTVWQQEFEDSFLYTETPDQLRSIEEIKSDMTSPKPMDRLLCGDVGFGKTEVAIRAVFRCVQDKKQVAVLVPTTILAQQHYTTFKERLADYPVRIGLVSRFRTAAQQRETLKALRGGEIDIIIGTHRLLSKDVEFLDLGLLVVDEEQRFGVKQKEKIKSMRASVDILTLSATPVPRTLHMALSGLRDMSTINTAPQDRLPVRTRVIRFVPEEIEEAVVRELNRGGQIYFVHNRVQSIQRVADRLLEIVPQARIAIGHGQMRERELEKVMFDFIERKYDILLSTTIIENGLDIPNVNTIIINRADAFGLAQLYQLRGRVGRDVKRAYAYLIIPEGHPITDTAIKRLHAIEEFTELGMGFQIAMRDLEIRGTGNILGSEQHGAIEAVGFELYCQLLEDAVKQLRGETHAATDFPVEIRWSLPAFLPAEYVPVESQRVAFYKRCSTAREPQQLDELTDELRDRYGKVPRVAKNLIAVSRLRLTARAARIERVAATTLGFKATPKGDVFDFLRRAQPLQDDIPNLTEVVAQSDGALLFKMRDWKPEQGVSAAAEVLARLES